MTALAVVGGGVTILVTIIVCVDAGTVETTETVAV